jgi:uncharacterized membrane protein
VAGEQASKILDLYETSNQAASRRRSLAMFALCGLAAAMIGLAVLLLVGYNWDAMSAAEKLTALFGALIGLHVAGFVARHQGRPLVAEVFFFLACMLYGASIWLIAQIFNIQSHYPNGIWFWALGTLPFALCLNTILLHALYAGLLAIWVGAEILGFTGVDHLFFFGWYVPGAAWTLPLMVLPGLIWAYKKQSVVAVGLYAPLLAWWAILQPIAWQWNVEPIYFVGLAGALLLLAAELHGEGSRLAIPYRLYGVLITGGVLVPLSSGDFVSWTSLRNTAADNFAAGWVIVLVGAVATLAVVVLQQRDRSRSWTELFRRQWLPLLLIGLMAGMCFWNGIYAPHDLQPAGRGSLAFGDPHMLNWTAQAIVPTAVFNVVMIVLSLWLMQVGLHEDRSAPFAAGVLYFMFWAILRYFDLFAGVGGMLGAALMFLLCGVGLLAVARFWFHRKEVRHV